MSQNMQNGVWKCTLCAFFIGITLRVLMNHYYTVHGNQAKFFVRCGVNDCLATFTRYHSFYKHVRKKHRNEYEGTLVEAVDDGQFDSDNLDHSSHISDKHAVNHTLDVCNLSQSSSTRHSLSTDEESSDSDTDDETLFQVVTTIIIG